MSRAYLGYYASDFQTPKGASRKGLGGRTGIAYRQTRQTQVSVDDVKVSIANDKATVKFPAELRVFVAQVIDRQDTGFVESPAATADSAGTRRLIRRAAVALTLSAAVATAGAGGSKALMRAAGQSLPIPIPA